jgi:peroxiredoxin Q/BCP
LYFYLKDNTTGCTKEAVNFSENIEEFERLNAKIIGISPDSTKSHRNFINKHNLRVILLSDPEHKVLEKYEIWQLKKRCGKESYGVVRTTFLISPTGKVEKIWKNVKVDGHADDVKCQLQDIIE